MELADLGVVGLAVMGENLVLNVESRGYRVAVFNRTTSRVDAFVAGRGKGKNVVGTHALGELAKALAKPRKVLLMVKAGAAVDATLDELVPHLEPGDVVVDGGNTHFEDTKRRAEALAKKGLRYVGAGVSGGEEGALTGPSIMPGGDAEAWPLLAPIFQAIAAKTDDGTPCCSWVGPEGAGHFVKMVHNGIEYGDMQIIAEGYDVLSRAGLTAPELADVFAGWNRGKLSSYLVEITAEILGHVDPETKQPLVDVILDRAGQKGTGKWTVNAAADRAVPLTLVSEAVLARFLSADKEGRVRAAAVLSEGAEPAPKAERDALVADVESALYAAKIVSYAQGFALLAAQSRAAGWKLDLGAISLLWRGGCIIRSVFLDRIKEAYAKDASLENLLLDGFFQEAIRGALPGWRRVVARAALAGVPVPAIASALAYYDGYRSARLPANLLQAQRDYFGAHTYERTDKPAGEFFHTNWTGRGGTTASTTYDA